MSARTPFSCDCASTLPAKSPRAYSLAHDGIDVVAGQHADHVLRNGLAACVRREFQPEHGRGRGVLDIAELLLVASTEWKYWQRRSSQKLGSADCLSNRSAPGRPDQPCSIQVRAQLCRGVIRCGHTLVGRQLDHVGLGIKGSLLGQSGSPDARDSFEFPETARRRVASNFGKSNPATKPITARSNGTNSARPSPTPTYLRNNASKYPTRTVIGF